LCAALAVALAAVAAGPAAGGGEKPGRFDALRFRSLGPAAGGRVSRATGVAGDPLVYYAATAQGGVWKSTDGGFEWKPLFDRQPVASIGSVAVAPSDPNVVYVGSGEANIRGNVIAGQGIFVSTDAGATWNHGWKQVGQIGTIGSGCSSSTRTPAPPTWRSTTRIRASSSPAPGRRGARPGT